MGAGDAGSGHGPRKDGPAPRARWPRPAAAAGGLVVVLLFAAAPPAGAATLSLPADAGAAPGASTTVDLSVDDASGMLGTDVVIQYDPAVATATAVSPTSISSGHVLGYNLSPPGTIRISLYGTAPLTGSGPLVEISFTSVGPPGSWTALDLAAADLNEGAIAVVLQDGGYCVEGVAAEVVNLRGRHVTGTTKALLTWDAHPWADSYNLYRGTTKDLADLTCYQAGLAGTSIEDDGAVPPLRTMFVYLVTAVTCAGESSAGTDSSGAERTLPLPCP